MSHSQNVIELILVSSLIKNLDFEVWGLSDNKVLSRVVLSSNIYISLIDLYRETSR